ncbi:MAG TPA: SurA N-terminal domain-containing protein [Pyrinomonadaceae bacterium]|nr:SurA N-terminal domain-containing protein [Pyrinomonadaceae bacterium]
MVNFQGAKATVHKLNIKIFTIAFLAFAAFALNACNRAASGDGSAESAASVNGKAIKMEEVERAIKLQAQGQEAKLSPLELAQARLQVLDGLIQQEVMFQKAEKEGVVPKDEDVVVELNKQKTSSGMSAEEFDKRMKEANETETSLREKIKRNLAIKQLVDKVTGKIEPPKDSEIEAFYNGNKEAFVKKRGVKLAAIVIDPANNGEGDTTRNDQEAALKGNEIINQLKQGGDFAAIAREKSEDQSRLQSGDLGDISEDELRQNFSPQVAAALMDPKFPIGQLQIAQAGGKFYILKLQERSDKDEDLTLESPGIRQKVTDSLISARKQLLAASYQAMVMNEAKIENFLAKKVVENPNELSGARPASAQTPVANTTANTAANANQSANASANTNTRVETKSPANANKTK